MEITPFLFLETIEQLLKSEIASNKDFSHGNIQTHRNINLFQKNTSLRLSWTSEPSADNNDLLTAKIQAIAHKGHGYAYNVFIQHGHGTEIILSLIPDDKTLQPESQKIFQFIKAYSLLALQQLLPQDTKLSEDPEDLLLKINPNYRKLPKKPEEPPAPEAETKTQPTEKEELTKQEA